MTTRVVGRLDEFSEGSRTVISCNGTEIGSSWPMAICSAYATNALIRSSGSVGREVSHLIRRRGQSCEREPIAASNGE